MSLDSTAFPNLHKFKNFLEDEPSIKNKTFQLNSFTFC